MHHEDKYPKAAEKFLQDSKMAAWHNETLWMVRTKRDKMGEFPEGRAAQQAPRELKPYSNSHHLSCSCWSSEKNATANGAIALGERRR